MEPDPEKGYVALLGWSLNAVEAAADFDRRYIVVAPDWAEEYCNEHDIPYMPWNFERINERSMEIAKKLQQQGVDVAIPLFEETVEWAGAINSVLLDKPRLLGQSMLMRDKSLMKRCAQLGGIRVGIFEEAHDRDDVVRYNDGTTHVIFEPLDFISKLAALVAKPRVNLTRFHGVFAPNSRHRAPSCIGLRD